MVNPFQATSESEISKDQVRAVDLREDALHNRYGKLETTLVCKMICSLCYNIQANLTTQWWSVRNSPSTWERASRRTSLRKKELYFCSEKQGKQLADMLRSNTCGRYCRPREATKLSECCMQTTFLWNSLHCKGLRQPCSFWDRHCQTTIHRKWRATIWIISSTSTTWWCNWVATSKASLLLCLVRPTGSSFSR